MKAVTKKGEIKEGLRSWEQMEGEEQNGPFATPGSQGTWQNHQAQATVCF